MKDEKKFKPTNTSSAIRKKKIAKNLFLAVCSVFLAGSVTGLAVACDEKTPPPAIITEGQETGVYYFADGNQEYLLTLNSGNRFTIVGAQDNRSGSYTIADGTLTFSFVKIGEEEAITMTGELDGDVLTLSFNGTATRFLKKVEYTVSFEVNGGSAVDSVSAMNGKTIGMPNAPTKEGYSFIGWYTDATCKTPFAFGSQPITANTKLYAGWVEDVKGQKEYVVNFNLGYEGAEDIEAITTIEGKLYGATQPTRDGYNFAGWWVGIGNSANKLSYQWTDDMVFDANTTLHALWTEKAPAGGKLVTPVVHVSGVNVSWNGVDNAQMYELTILDANGNEVLYTTLGATSKNVDFASMSAGEYKVIVKALASDDTKNSEEVVRYFANKMLTRVSQFSVIEPSVLLFNAVDNAEGYLITVECGTDGHVHTQFNNGSSTSYNFANCETDDGVIKFTVTAVANGYASSVSETFVYVREPLSEVTGVYVDQATETLVWEAVEGATNYVITVVCGDSEHKHIVNNGTKTSYSLKECETTSEGIKITILAEAKGYDSAEATEYVYQKEKLATPHGFVLTDTTLNWNAVEGATSYVVKIGSQTYTTNTNSIDLSMTGVNFVGGNSYEVSVYAKSDANQSLFSDVVKVSYYAMNSELSYKDGYVSWQPVMGAKAYEVKVNGGKTIRITNGVHTSKVEFTKAGVNTITVRYYDGEMYSDWASLEVYAHEIIFDSRAGANVSTMYKANGDTIVLPDTTKNGYDFQGWYNTPGGVAGNGAKYENGVVNVTGSIALYASWTPSKITVNYNVNNNEDATLTTPSTQVTYTENFTLEVPVSEDEDKMFVGWFTSQTGAESDRLTDEHGVSVKPFNFYNEVTVYACWANVLSFTKAPDGTYKVAKGKDISKMKEVRIPATYKGELVTVLDAYAFQYASKLEKIYIPDTIQLIERNVFYACPNLQEVIMYTPELEDHYNYEVLYEAVDGMLLRNFPDYKQIYFIPAAKTGRIAIPEGVTEIPAGVFTGINVNEVVIPTTVTSIRKKAFYNCTSLKRVTFTPAADGETASALEIQTNAFQNCTSLTSVSLPKRLSSISIDTEAGIPDVFTGCNALAYVHIEDGSAQYASLDGMLTNVYKTKILFCPTARAGVVSIPDVIDIAPYAFKNCDRITEISIPGSVDTIGEGAFEGCDRLTKVHFEETNGVGGTIVGKNAFKDCGKLQVLSFHEDSEVLTIGETAFAGCVTLTDIQFPKSLTRIETKAFSGCKAITKLVFAEDGTSLSLGDYSFENCLSLKTVTLPACVNQLALGAFNGCASLEKIFVDEDNQTYCDEDGIVFTKDKSEILYYSLVRTAKTYTLPAETTRIAGAVFKGNKVLTSFVIPARVTYIGESVFEGCTNIKTFTIEQGETDIVDLEIAKNALKGCTNSSFKTLVLPERTKTLGEGVIQGCSKLTTVTLPSTLTSIPKNMFYGCSALNNLVIPATVTSIGDNAFYSCYGWTNTADTPLVLPANLVSIGNNAFQSCSKLVAVQIPETVTSIGTAVFKSCSKLTTVNIPTNITAIPASFFEGCSALTSFNIPAHITSIGASAFKSTKLTQIVIPAGVTSIGDSAFASISTLVDKVENSEVTQQAVTFATGCALTEISANVFSGSGTTTSGASVSITIPKSVTKIGTKAFYNTKFRTVIFEDGGTEALVIDASAFESSSSSASSNYLATVELPDRLVSIGSKAFYYSAKLSNLVINETSNLKTIGSQAFYRSALTSIYIPASVQDVTNDAGTTTIGIGANAFADTTKLATITFAMDSAVAVVDDGEESTTKPVLTIGSSAFGGSSTSYKNTLLTSVKFPSRLANLAVNAFANCTNLASFEVQEGGDYYTTDSGILYSADKATLYLCPIAKEGEVVVPNTVTLVKSNAFYNCAKITKVTFTDAEEGSAAMAEGMLLGDGAQASNNVSYSVFGGCNLLTEVILPNYLKAIGPMAFSGGYSSATKPVHPPITTIAIPASVESIGAYAFYSNISIQTISFAENGKLEEIAYCAFYSSSITAIEIPASVVAIGNSAFSNTKSLTSLTFADYSVTAKFKSIGESAFSSSKLVGDLRLPDSTEAIGSGAFSSCVFDTVYVPQLVASLNGAYNSVTCSAFVVPEANAHFVSKEGVLYTKSLGYNGVGTLMKYPLLRGVVENEDGETENTITTYDIIPGTTAIADSAFNANKVLTKVTIPNTVTSIGLNAFNNASNLATVEFEEGGVELTIANSAFSYTKIASLNLPAHLVSIGNNSFYGISALQELSFTEGCTLQTIGTQAFAGAKSLYGGATAMVGDPDDEYEVDAVVLPAHLKSLGDKAFAGCQSLEYIIFPQGLETIGSYIFDQITVNNVPCYAPYLAEVTIPSSVVTIGEGAFSNAGIDTLVIEEGITEIPARAFQNTCISELVLPDSITAVGDYAFYCCEGLEKITFSANLETIGNYAFYENGFKEIIVPNTIKTIGNSAFENCTKVESIELRDGIISIGDSAFAGCSKVTVMQLPASLETLGSDPFRGMVFESFGVDPSNQNIILVDGIMYDSTKETILKYFGSAESLTIPYRVTRIGGGAFANNTTLREIIMHEDITYIGDYAFQNTLFETFTIGAKVSYLGKYAFADCENLKSVTFENGCPSLKILSEGVFKNCELLSSVSLPKYIESAYDSNYNLVPAIGHYAFYGCWSLTSIDLGSIQTYYSIGRYAFAYTGLTSVTITYKCNTWEGQKGQGEYDIDEGAFEGCDNLVSVTFEYDGQSGEGPTQTCGSIFSDCWSLEEVNIPDDYWYGCYWEGDAFENSPFEGEFY